MRLTIIEKILKTFEKVLDILPNLWYYISVPRGERNTVASLRRRCVIGTVRPSEKLSKKVLKTP
jgi:hypothetical protein